jgi:Na+/H+ antiporter NhaA
VERRGQESPLQGHPDDIAFSYLVARIIFGAKHPGIPFLLLLAIAADALGLMILAVFYPSGDLRLSTFAIVLRRGDDTGVVA